ncbi:MAG: YicC family protein [Legionellales bacterium]|nr:YicC family protein [Legionellales bacterium]
MIQSMTAFARYVMKADWGLATWEIKSVNHRYLEMNIRLPEVLRELEMQVRADLKQTLTRGKIDVILNWQVTDEQVSSLSLNNSLVQSLNQVGRSLVMLTENAAPLRAIDILQWPGVVTQNTVLIPAIQQDILTSLQQALTQLLQNRAQEGKEITNMIYERMDKMQWHITQAQQVQARELLLQREKIQERLKQAKITLDANRLEQEMVMLANKMDLAEELERLTIHLAQMRQTLEQGQVCGRRLDFLLQELNREANTLGAKALHTLVTQASIEMKVLIEQMREQVQNLE